MKIRYDFVTNSSSSSYIVAVKNGTTIEDIKDALNINELNSFIVDYCVEDLSEKSNSEIIEEFADDIKSRFGSYPDMNLGEWDLWLGHIYSDDLQEYLAEAAVYYNAFKQNDKIKVTTVCG